MRNSLITGIGRYMFPMPSFVWQLVPGIAIDIPVGTAFQYRNVSETKLKFIYVSMPPWPGESEATYVKGIWEPTI